MTLALVAAAAAVAHTGWERHRRRSRLRGLAGSSTKRTSRSLYVPRHVDSLIDGAELDLSAGVVLWVWLGSVLVAGVAMAAQPSVVVLVVGCAITAGGPAWVIRRRRGADERLVAALPGALDGVARGLRAGLSLAQAMDGVEASLSGRLAGEWREVRRRREAGSMLTDSLAVWDRSADLSPLRLAITTLILAAQAGGARARAIDNVVASLHDRLTLGAEVRAHSAQAVLSAMTMSVLPVVFLAVSSSIDPDVGRVLLTTRTGLVCLVGGLVLDAAGAVWMLRIVGRVR